MDSRRRKLPVPHVHKAGVCFSIEDIPPELPWTPDEGSEDQSLDSEEDAGSPEESSVEDDGDAVRESEDDEKSEETDESEESSEVEQTEESEET